MKFKTGLIIASIFIASIIHAQQSREKVYYFMRITARRVNRLRYFIINPRA
jgi:hypothetical protein